MATDEQNQTLGDTISELQHIKRKLDTIIENQETGLTNQQTALAKQDETNKKLDKIIEANTTLGGDVGARYLAFRKYLTYPENLTWLVNDIPAVVALGRTIAEQEAAVHLKFTTNYARLGEADILLASGVLQVLEDWNGFLHRAPNLPRCFPR